MLSKGLQRSCAGKEHTTMSRVSCLHTLGFDSDLMVGASNSDAGSVVSQF